MVDKAVIKEWHAFPEARGIEGSNMNKLWHVGQSMLAALEPDSEEDTDSDEDEEDSEDSE